MQARDDESIIARKAVATMSVEWGDLENVMKQLPEGMWTSLGARAAAEESTG